MHQKRITLRLIDSLYARAPTASLRLIDLAYARAQWSKLFLNLNIYLVATKGPDLHGRRQGTRFKLHPYRQGRPMLALLLRRHTSEAGGVLLALLLRRVSAAGGVLLA